MYSDTKDIPLISNWNFGEGGRRLDIIFESSLVLYILTFHMLVRQSVSQSIFFNQEGRGGDDLKFGVNII